MVKKKYRALRFVAFIFQVLAWVSLVFGILGAIGVGAAGFMGVISVPAIENSGSALPLTGISTAAGIGSAVLLLVFAILNFVLLLAAAEYLYCLVDTEQNTRTGTEYLRLLLQTQQTAVTPQPESVVTTPVASSTQPVAVSYPVEPHPAEPTVTTPTAPAPK
ncbi:MAG TPA: hypothetical protein VGK87_17275 [Anaerolineae bacterium]|jgi:hypothetical protein